MYTKKNDILMKTYFLFIRLKSYEVLETLFFFLIFTLLLDDIEFNLISFNFYLYWKKYAKSLRFLIGRERKVEDALEL